ncbi:hypothetical protein HPB51_013587 [Rhipicephalus microplus]|uniref:Uncharacterized protein n=1 Tax=Rhipicephalus microplus TaxID=6941 RepID=A0A9J6DVI2_RHIMP|nr:hypothetical protein HPB51_013587 [Rhipicephalus microplus]
MDPELEERLRRMSDGMVFKTYSDTPFRDSELRAEDDSSDHPPPDSLVFHDDVIDHGRRPQQRYYEGPSASRQNRWRGGMHSMRDAYVRNGLQQTTHSDIYVGRNFHRNFRNDSTSSVRSLTQRATQRFRLPEQVGLLVVVKGALSDNLSTKALDGCRHHAALVEHASGQEKVAGSSSTTSNNWLDSPPELVQLLAHSLYNDQCSHDAEVHVANFLATYRAVSEQFMKGALKVPREEAHLLLELQCCCLDGCCR